MSILNTLRGPPVIKHYRSKDGRAIFKFSFAPQGDHVAVYCLSHPPLNGRDPSVSKLHLFSSGQLCFVEGRAPKDMRRAEQLAGQWAEYFLEYRRTGIAQY